MPTNYICALDIGSSKIAAAVAQVKRSRINNLFLESSPLRAVKKGTVVDSTDFIDVLGKTLKNLRAKSGLNIKFVYASISGDGIITKHSRAIIPLAQRGNKVITSLDMQKVCEQALILGSSIEEEIIHHIPFSYAIDSSSNLINPLGLYSHRLEVDLYLVCVKLAYLQTLTHIINQAGYELLDLYFSGLATSRVVFGPESKKGIGLLCDLGSDITELLVFKDGVLKDIEILPFGGNDFTVELAKELKIPEDAAEEIKISYGIVGDLSLDNQEKEILFRKENNYQPIKQSKVSIAITPQAKSICYKLKEAIAKHAHPQEINNFYLVGRAALQEGFLEMLETVLGISVVFGKLKDPEMAHLACLHQALAGQRYLAYLTCLGIVSQVVEGYQPGVSTAAPSSRNPIFKVIHKAKELYQEYF